MGVVTGGWMGGRERRMFDGSRDRSHYLCFGLATDPGPPKPLTIVLPCHNVLLPLAIHLLLHGPYHPLSNLSSSPAPQGPPGTRKPRVVQMQKLKGLTSFSSSILHFLPCPSNNFRFISVRRLLISSYDANCIDPFDTPTKARREPLYNPRIPSTRYIVRSPSTYVSTHHPTEREHPAPCDWSLPPAVGICTGLDSWWMDGWRVRMNIPQRPLNAAGSFLAVANTLVLTTHIGFVNIAVTAPCT